MDEQGFRDFLKKNRRSDSAIERCVAFVKDLERYLREHERGKSLEEASLEDLEDFALWGEMEWKSANTHLWGLTHYFEYTSNAPMRDLASRLRGKKIKRQPFALGGFRGVVPAHVEKLASVGITNVEEMLEAGRTRGAREELSEKTGVPLEAILELVKLSDLARLPGVKGIRARLYYDAGIDTLDKMAAWDSEELREMLIEFVERTGFDGVAPWPKEASSAVTTAQKLPRTVEY